MSSVIDSGVLLIIDHIPAITVSKQAIDISGKETKISSLCHLENNGAIKKAVNRMRQIEEHTKVSGVTIIFFIKNPALTVRNG